MDWSKGEKMSIYNGSNAVSTPRGYQQHSTRTKNRSTHIWVVEITFIAISLLTYLLDIVTDILVGVDYLQKGEVIWGSLTFALVLMPSIIIQIISACWYTADDKPHGPACWMLHIFQLQPLERYLSVLVTGAEAQASGREEDLAAYHYQMNDVCMLRLFEAFLESAPQLTLQLFVICCTDTGTWLTGICVAMSILAVGWAVASYSHALRQAYKEHYSAVWPGLILQTLWHMAMAAARVLSIVAFASVFKAWVFLVLGVHWMVMTTWVMLQNTDFCPSTIQERFFNAIVGIIYCFSFFNLKEGRSRYRMTAFYVVMLVENAGLMAAWFVYRDPEAWYNNIILITVPCGFVLGVACLLIYYRCCHPSGPIYLKTPVEDPAPQIPALARSPIELPRRAAMLKQASARLYPIQFKEVCSPSQLSPIPAANSPAHHRPSTNGSFEMEDMSAWYQHYSVDASACLVSPPQESSVRAAVMCNPLDDSDSSDASSVGVVDVVSESSSDSSCDSPLGSPVRPASLYSSPALHQRQQQQRQPRVLFLDHHLHTPDRASHFSPTHGQCFNLPNASIRYIDATDTETVGDSDGDILDMSDIHFSYLKQIKPRTDTS